MYTVQLLLPEKEEFEEIIKAPNYKDIHAHDQCT